MRDDNLICFETIGKKTVVLPLSSPHNHNHHFHLLTRSRLSSCFFSSPLSPFHHPPSDLAGCERVGFLSRHYRDSHTEIIIKYWQLTVAFTPRICLLGATNEGQPLRFLSKRRDRQRALHALPASVGAIWGLGTDRTGSDWERLTSLFRKDSLSPRVLASRQSRHFSKRGRPVCRSTGGKRHKFGPLTWSGDVSPLKTRPHSINPRLSRRP